MKMLTSEWNTHSQTFFRNAFKLVFGRFAETSVLTKKFHSNECFSKPTEYVIFKYVGKSWDMFCSTSFDRIHSP